MIRQRKWMATVAAIALGAVVGIAAVAHAQFPFAPAPQPAPQPGQQPFPQPTPPSDPRALQIKAGLEQQGLRVYQVGFMPGSGRELPRWYAETAANYAKPDYGPVAQQALMIWAVMYNVVGGDPPQTVLIGDQVWAKYSLLFAVQIGTLKVFVDNYRAASTDAARTRALQILFQAAQFRVYDNERRQFVDEKDFVNKNFGGG